MLTIRSAVVAIAILLVATAALPQPEVEPPLPAIRVELQLVPSSTLPGIPPDLRLTVQNTGRDEIVLPTQAFLLVTAEGAKPRVARDPGLMESNNAFDFSDEWGEVRIKPGARVTVNIENDGTLVDMSWFRDRIFSAPGQLRLELLLGNGIVGERPPDVLQGRYVTSTPAFLKIAEPAGDDAVVWKKIQEFEKTPAREEQWYSKRQALWYELVTSYPDSAYTPWLIASGAGASQGHRPAMLKEWLDKHPDDRHRDAKMMQLAEAEYWQSGFGSDEESLRHEQEAQRIARSVTKSKSAKARALAAKLLKQIEDDN